MGSLLSSYNTELAPPQERADDGPNYCVSPERSRRDQGIQKSSQTRPVPEMPEMPEMACVPHRYWGKLRVLCAAGALAMTPRKANELAF